MRANIICTVFAVRGFSERVSRPGYSGRLRAIWTSNLLEVRNSRGGFHAHYVSRARRSAHHRHRSSPVKIEKEEGLCHCASRPPAVPFSADRFQIVGAVHKRRKQTLPDLLDPAAPRIDRGFVERNVTPEETLCRVWSHLDRLGITRVSRQTGLDRIGIHTWSAARPNAKALSVSQGKGTSDAAACVSAVMEAVEIAVAESIPTTIPIDLAAANDFPNRVCLYDPTRLLPIGATFNRSRPIRWLQARDLHTGDRHLVPCDAVDMDCDRSDLPGICKHSSGLASGNTEDEAIFHAVCELIERDGTSLWSLRGEEGRLSTCFAPDLRDAEISELFEAITKAKCRVTLFDQTSDLGIPVVMAVLGPAGPDYAGELEVTSGYGCHSVTAIAVIRAITEAAQSRITTIAGVRDDIDQSAFRRRAPLIHMRLLQAVPVAEPPQDPLIGVSGVLGTVKAALAKAGCGASVVTLPDRELPAFVVKVLSFDLEDRSANMNWRPGRRAFDFVEGQLS